MCAYDLSLFLRLASPVCRARACVCVCARAPVVRCVCMWCVCVCARALSPPPLPRLVVFRSPELLPCARVRRASEFPRSVRFSVRRLLGVCDFSDRRFFFFFFRLFILLYFHYCSFWFFFFAVFFRSVRVLCARAQCSLITVATLGRRIAITRLMTSWTSNIIATTTDTSIIFT